MSHYLREHLDAVGELPQKLRETMSSIGMLDERVQSISALIDTDIGEVARARQRYYAQFESTEGDQPGSPPRPSKAKVRETLSLPLVGLFCFFLLSLLLLPVLFVVSSPFVFGF